MSKKKNKKYTYKNQTNVKNYKSFFMTKIHFHKALPSTHEKNKISFNLVMLKYLNFLANWDNNWVLWVNVPPPFQILKGKVY